MTSSTPAPTDAGALADALKAIIQMDDDARDANGKPEANLNGVGLVDLFDCVNHPFGSGEHKQQPYRSNQLEAALSDARTALVEYTRNSAPQETRGDEPVGYVVRFNDQRCFYWERGVAERKAGEFEDKHKTTPTIDPVFYAASQQSPRLEREGLKEAAESLKFIRLQLIGNLEEPERSAFWRAVEARNAILALLSPDTAVVSSTSRASPASPASHTHACRTCCGDGHINVHANLPDVKCEDCNGTGRGPEGDPDCRSQPVSSKTLGEV